MSYWNGTKIWTLGGPKHEPKKFQVTWFIKKKKIMVDKTIALYYHKYLSQEGNNMNKKSWKLQYDILTFSKKKNKKRSTSDLQILGNWN